MSIVTLDKGVKWKAVLVSEDMDPEDRFQGCQLRTSFLVTCDGADDCQDNNCHNRVLQNVLAFDRATVRRTRVGKGHGLFAKRNIVKDEPMVEYGGVVMKRNKADLNNSEYKLQYHKGSYVVDAKDSNCMGKCFEMCQQ